MVEQKQNKISKLLRIWMHKNKQNTTAFSNHVQY